MICRKTMQQCQTPSMCAPFHGCQPDKHETTGWKCPSCGKGNAPWQALCANEMCGVQISIEIGSIAGDHHG